MARRSKDGLFEDFVAMPWPVGVAVGIGGFIWLSQTAWKPLAWVALVFGLVTGGLSALGAMRRRKLLDQQTGLESLRAMSWKEFELLVGEAYRRLGYRIEETGQGGADGGIDLALRKDGAIVLVQCKQWRNQRIGVAVVREMYGLMVHHGAAAVKIVCAGSYSGEAEAFARGKPIELVDGQALLRLVESVRVDSSPITHTQPTAPVPFPEKRAEPAIADDASAPACPKCEATMLRRTNRSTGQAFWGCPKFPGCRATIAIAASER